MANKKDLRNVDKLHEMIGVDSTYQLMTMDYYYGKLKRCVELMLKERHMKDECIKEYIDAMDSVHELLTDCEDDVLREDIWDDSKKCDYFVIRVPVINENGIPYNFIED